MTVLLWIFLQVQLAQRPNKTSSSSSIKKHREHETEKPALPPPQPPFTTKEEYPTVLKDRNECSDEEMSELSKKFPKDPVIIESSKSKEKDAKTFSRKVSVTFLFIFEYLRFLYSLS